MGMPFLTCQIGVSRREKAYTDLDYKMFNRVGELSQPSKHLLVLLRAAYLVLLSFGSVVIFNEKDGCRSGDGNRKLTRSPPAVEK
jgi:hypothetical protein